MIHGVILPVYGFWLPNDPRGSWSLEFTIYRVLAPAHAHRYRKAYTAAERGRESFSGEDLSHGKRLPRKRLPTPFRRSGTRSKSSRWRTC
jgi:hypothetical protein